MGFIARRRIAMWSYDLETWAQRSCRNPDLSPEEQAYALGVILYINFSKNQARVPNPFDSWIETYPPETFVGVQDANELMNRVLTTEVVPGTDFPALLREAHSRRVGEEIITNEIADVVNGEMDRIAGELQQDLSAAIAASALSEEEKASALAALEGMDYRLPVDGSLSEDRYAVEKRTWAQVEIGNHAPGSFESDFLQGLVLATLVRDGEADALMIDFRTHPDGPWMSYSAAFMLGYSTTMQSWGNETFFSRVAFDPEQVVTDMTLMKKYRHEIG